jgi:magnesium-transporting ATPase (P-type)
MCNNLTKKSSSETSPPEPTTMTTAKKATPLSEQEVSGIKELLKSINQPQALERNLKNLSSLGGTDGLVSLLHTNRSAGIDASSVAQRRALLGTNSLPSAPRNSFWQLFVDTFDDATLQILIAAAIVSLVIGVYDDPATGYVEGLAILAAVLIVSVVTAVNDYQKESQFRDLSKANDEVDVLVMRSGKATQIGVEELVVGDVVCIEAGDQIPCDGVLLQGDGLEVDESALTGEPIDIDKDLVNDPFVLSGCNATAGSAQFLAIAVGKDSQWGVIKSHLEKEQEQTPLQEKLDDMAALIGYVGMAAAAATFVAMMYIKIVIKPAYLNDISIFHHALDAFIIGVTIVVVAVPEGLPLAVTISLAYSTKQMLADQNLIRHLAACETMGNATNICSDKTGTLTENRMTVVKGWFANHEEEDATAMKDKNKISRVAREVLFNAISCCATARIVPADPADDSGPIRDSRPHVIGNKTEAALLLWSQSQYDDDYEARRSKAKFGEVGGSRLFPFSSARKRMSVLVASEGEDTDVHMTRKTSQSLTKWTLYHKGAAEALLENCTKYLDTDGSEKDMTNTKMKEMKALIKEYASEALRCVAVCHRNNIEASLKIDPSKATLVDVESKLENNLTLDAIVGIADPLRLDVVDAVATCQRAGIFVRMVTGDNLDTANAIAKEAGILTEGGLSMVGEDFRKLTPRQLDDILPRLQVLARSSPEDKHMLVQRLNGGLMPETEEEWLEAHPGRNFEKEKDLILPGYKQEWAERHQHGGEVVGVTGDGTNDGPALKAADVGLSMGLSGTDVAKKASDIIIMDDNFSSIVK